MPISICFAEIVLIKQETVEPSAYHRDNRTCLIIIIFIFIFYYYYFICARFLSHNFSQRGSVNKAHFMTQPNLLITPHN